MRSLPTAAAALILAGLLAPACSSSDDGADPGTSSGGDADGGPVTPGADGSVAPSTDGGGEGGPAGPSCTNGKKDGKETDVDCGGDCMAKCKALSACAVASDCVTGFVCVKKVCSSPAANDGMKNGDESDVDCGGKAAPPCEVGKACLAPADCAEKVCDANVCLAATPTDGVKNGNETDVDCGGGGPAPACADTKKCSVAARDCASKVCTAGACVAPSPSDGVMNGNETDIDCGGGAPAALCGNGKTCVNGATDCTSFVCNVTCQAPTGTDGVKNGNESDIDCGGTNTGAPKCDPTYACGNNADCKSDGCDYNNTCAVTRSCATRLGGDTCGSGEVGEGGAVHESCCTQAPLTGSAATIDKYHVTAGRMRQFITRVGGNARGFVAGVAGWNAAWSPYVPSTVAEANTYLGSYWLGADNQNDLGTNAVSKRSCNPSGFGGHTYWTPASAGGDPSDYTQAQLDPKALNCVGWHLARAFCAWDGGRLATQAELTDAFTNNGANQFPWQFADATPYNINVVDARLNHKFSYGYPGNPRRIPAIPANMGTVQDITWYVAPPGRHPLGANANGAQDVAGNLLHYVNNIEYGFTWTVSWENHGKSLGTTSWKTQAPEAPNGYYGIGFRCAHD